MCNSKYLIIAVRIWHIFIGKLVYLFHRKTLNSLLLIDKILHRHFISHFLCTMDILNAGKKANLSRFEVSPMAALKMAVQLFFQ